MGEETVLQKRMVATLLCLKNSWTPAGAKQSLPGWKIILALGGAADLACDDLTWCMFRVKSSFIHLP